ncbi:hypothetical protein BJQ97_01418 [Geobacillus sp. TFV-3]|nr:hypothetical protein BJQ97_01418 [Geobacillus sp. TFV-3]
MNETGGGFMASFFLKAGKKGVLFRAVHLLCSQRGGNENESENRFFPHEAGG